MAFSEGGSGVEKATIPTLQEADSVLLWVRPTHGAPGIIFFFFCGIM